LIGTLAVAELAASTSNADSMATLVVPSNARTGLHSYSKEAIQAMESVPVEELESWCKLT